MIHKRSLWPIILVLEIKLHILCPITVLEGISFTYTMPMVRYFNNPRHVIQISNKLCRISLWQIIYVWEFKPYILFIISIFELEAGFPPHAPHSCNIFHKYSKKRLYPIIFHTILHRYYTHPNKLYSTSLFIYLHNFWMEV